MSVDRITMFDLDHDEQQRLDILLTELKTKTPRNRIRGAYYDGKNAVRDIGISTPPSMRRIATVLGWSAKAVDLLNKRCNLDGFLIPGDVSVDDVGLTQVWHDNNLDRESRHAGLSSLIHSTAFLITTRGDAEAGEPEVLVIAKSALSGTGTWNRRRRALDSFLSVIDTDDEANPTEMVMYLDNVNVFMTKRNGRWMVERAFHDDGVPVEPLSYKSDLDRPFGRSRISRAVMSLHDQAIRTVIRSETTAEIYSVPQRALLGADESAFKNADGTVKSAWQAILGQVWAIPDDEDAANPRAEIKEFSAASQQPHVDQLRAWSQLFAGETSIPIGSLGLGGSDANPTSAASYDASREDLVHEAEDTTDGWTLAWRRTALRALTMLNGWTDVPDEVKGLQPKWRNAATPSRAAAADAGLKTIQAFPWIADTEVGLEIMGFDQQTIIRLMADKRRMGGSAALRAITEAATAGRPAVTSGDPNAG